MVRRAAQQHLMAEGQKRKLRKMEDIVDIRNQKPIDLRGGSAMTCKDTQNQGL
jgi:hypothetical protein